MAFLRPYFTRSLLIMLVLTAAPVEARSTSKLKIYVSCVLRSSYASCVDFKNAFFEDHAAFVTMASNVDESDLDLSLTDEVVGNGQIGYNFAWTPHLTGTTQTAVSIPLLLSSAQDALSTLSALTKAVQKQLILFLELIDESVTDDGSVVVTFKPPKGSGDDNAKPGWMDRLAKTPWYFSVSVYGYGSSSGSGDYNSSSRSFPISTEIAYLVDRYKVDVDGSVYHTSQSIPDGDGQKISASNTNVSFSGDLIYSFSKNWSVAVIQSYNRNTGANIEFQNQTASGIEWTMVPFRTSENREIAFRLGPQYTSLSLGQANDLGHTREKLWSAFAQVYFYWVALGDKLTMTLNGGGEKNLTYLKNYTVSASSNVSYQINAALSIYASATESYSPKSLIYPGAPDYSNPLKTLFLNNAPGASFNTSIGFDLKLGNSRRKTRDRRWTRH